MNLFARILAACLAMAAFAANAAYGITVTRGQEAAVRIGMTSDEVHQILGRPADAVNFRNAPGPSWSYDLVGAYGTITFDVDFGPDGRVIAARERATPRG